MLGFTSLDTLPLSDVSVAIVIIYSQQNNVGQNSAGFVAKRAYKYRFKPDVELVIQEIALTLPDNPIREIKRVLKAKGIDYVAEYGKAIKAQIKAQIEIYRAIAEMEDEEILILFL